MFDALIKLANKLDSRGLIKEANKLDLILASLNKEAAFEDDPEVDLDELMRQHIDELARKKEEIREELLSPSEESEEGLPEEEEEEEEVVFQPRESDIKEERRHEWDVAEEAEKDLSQHVASRILRKKYKNLTPEQIAINLGLPRTRKMLRLIEALKSGTSFEGLGFRQPIQEGETFYSRHGKEIEVPPEESVRTNERICRSCGEVGHTIARCPKARIDYAGEVERPLRYPAKPQEGFKPVFKLKR